jgi:hypothetical protein
MRSKRVDVHSPFQILILIVIEIEARLHEED